MRIQSGAKGRPGDVYIEYLMCFISAFAIRLAPQLPVMVWEVAARCRRFSGFCVREAKAETMFSAAAFFVWSPSINAKASHKADN